MDARIPDSTKGSKPFGPCTSCLVDPGKWTAKQPENHLFEKENK